MEAEKVWNVKDEKCFEAEKSRNQPWMSFFFLLCYESKMTPDGFTINVIKLFFPGSDSKSNRIKHIKVS